ncbi:hypothetical protein RND81_01G053900 [Saponaria officinalis]
MSGPNLPVNNKPLMASSYTYNNKMAEPNVRSLTVVNDEDTPIYENWKITGLLDVPEPQNASYDTKIEQVPHAQKVLDELPLPTFIKEMAEAAKTVELDSTQSDYEPASSIKSVEGDRFTYKQQVFAKLGALDGLNFHDLVIVGANRERFSTLNSLFRSQKIVSVVLPPKRVLTLSFEVNSKPSFMPKIILVVNSFGRVALSSFDSTNTHFLRHQKVETNSEIMFYTLKNGWKLQLSYKEVYSWGNFDVDLVLGERLEAISYSDQSMDEFGGIHIFDPGGNDYLVCYCQVCSKTLLVTSLLCYGDAWLNLVDDVVNKKISFLISLLEWDTQPFSSTLEDKGDFRGEEENVCVKFKWESFHAVILHYCHFGKGSTVITREVSHCISTKYVICIDCDLHLASTATSDIFGLSLFLVAPKAWRTTVYLCPIFNMKRIYASPLFWIFDLYDGGCEDKVILLNKWVFKHLKENISAAIKQIVGRTSIYRSYMSIEYFIKSNVSSMNIWYFDRWYSFVRLSICTGMSKNAPDASILSTFIYFRKFFNVGITWINKVVIVFDPGGFESEFFNYRQDYVGLIIWVFDPGGLGSELAMTKGPQALLLRWCFGDKWRATQILRAIC